MKNIFFLLDGLGYEQIMEHRPGFLYGIGQSTKIEPVDTLLGYSSGIYASLWTGRYADQLGFWSEFTRREKKVPIPFNFLYYFPGRFFPRQLFYLFSLVRQQFGSEPAQYYGIPPVLFGEFERSPVDYGSLPHINMSSPALITSRIQQMGKRISYCFLPKIDYSVQVQVIDAIEHSDILVIVVPETDHYGHLLGPFTRDYRNFLDDFDNRLASLCSEIQRVYPEVSLNFFSDHGMTPVNRTFDLWGFLNQHRFRLGKDYVMFINSTLASFWFDNERTGREILELLNGSGEGHFLDSNEKEQYHLNFRDRRYGDEIFVVGEGAEVVPNFISLMRKPNAGMHGYEPKFSSTCAFYIGDKQLQDQHLDATGIYHVFLQDL